MITAIAVALVVAIVFALGVYFGHQHGREQRDELKVSLDHLSNEHAQTRENWVDWVEEHVFVGSYTDRYDEEGL